MRSGYRLKSNGNSAGVSSAAGDVSAVGCQDLWRSVLFRAMNDAFPAKGVQSPPCVEAKRWFGGRQFYHVCRLAGVEPTWVLRLIETPEFLNRDRLLGPRGNTV